MLYFRFKELNLSVCMNNDIKIFYLYSDFVDFIKDYTKVLPIKLSTYSNKLDSLTKWKYTISVSILDYKTKRFKIIGYINFIIWINIKYIIIIKIHIIKAVYFFKI